MARSRRGSRILFVGLSVLAITSRHHSAHVLYLRALSAQCLVKMMAQRRLPLPWRGTPGSSCSSELLSPHMIFPALHVHISSSVLTSSLHGNGISTAGVEKLALALSSNRTLKTLASVLCSRVPLSPSTWLCISLQFLKHPWQSTLEQDWR